MVVDTRHAATCSIEGFRVMVRLEVSIGVRATHYIRNCCDSRVMNSSSSLRRMAVAVYNSKELDYIIYHCKKKNRLF